MLKFERFHLVWKVSKKLSDTSIEVSSVDANTLSNLRLIERLAQFGKLSC